MMMTTAHARTRITIAAAADALLLAACSADTESTETPAPTLEATATSESSEPAETETPAVTADSPVGTVVPKDRVEELRDAGAQVYVPTQGGEPVIVERSSELPEAVQADASAVAALPESAVPNGMGYMEREIEAAGLSAFIIFPFPTINDPGPMTYKVSAVNVPGLREFWSSIGGGAAGHATKEAALAEVRPLIDANPGVPIYDPFE